MRNRVLLAELNHLADAAHRHACFRRAGLIVQAGVEHTAVVAGLMPADGGLFLNHRDLGVS